MVAPRLVRCPVCNWPYVLRRDGTLRAHDRDVWPCPGAYHTVKERCPGSGKAPNDGVALP